MTGRTARHRAAVLGRLRKALDAFYLLQDIDWEFDVRQTLDKILDLAIREVKLEGGAGIERAMIILRSSETEFECHAGWFTGSRGLEFSRSIIEEVLSRGETVVCDEVGVDERFARSHSVRRLELTSFVCIPIRFGSSLAGAFFVDTSGARTRLEESDRQFLEEFVALISPYLKTALLHRTHLDRLSETAEVSTEFHGLVGASKPMRRLFDQIRLVAGSSATVLVQGETGTGKELVARAIHAESARAAAPFVPVHCAAIPRTLLESELFGHRKGAFTGADADREGLAATADGGTLFLDEIGEIELAVQAKLLRLLQEGELRPVGSDRARRVDVRVVAATHRDLRTETAAGRFREDLFFRVNVLPLDVPPLRDRMDDLALLVHHFLAASAREEGTKARRAGPEVRDILRARAWPGNVRELQHVLARAALFCDGTELRPEHLAPDVAAPAGGFDLGLEEVRRLRGEAGEKEYLERVLAAARDQAAGRVDLLERAVEILGDASLPTLRRRIRKLGIDLSEYVPKRSGRRRS